MFHRKKILIVTVSGVILIAGCFLLTLTHGLRNERDEHPIDNETNVTVEETEYFEYLKVEDYEVEATDRVTESEDREAGHEGPAVGAGREGQEERTGREGQEKGAMTPKKAVKETGRATIRTPFEQGYWDGYESGYDDGDQNAGYGFSYPSAMKSEEYAAGFRKGYREGFAEGIEDYRAFNDEY